MLTLDDSRWQYLTTFFQEPHDIPKALAEWLLSIGHDQEMTIYHRSLLDIFLHQATITNAAFAIVPWIVHVCKRGETRYQAEYLTDVALVEANRIIPGVYLNLEGTEPYPEWLMADYHTSIAEARDLVDDVLNAELDTETRDMLIAIKPALYGNAELAWSQW
jgi:hypothetical protein